MARRRFFVPAVQQGRARLEGDEAHHLTRVLRVEAGHRYEISDNERPYLAEVLTARKSLVEFRVLEDVAPTPLPVRITLGVALIKFDRLEWILEKATELGVTDIQLLEAERSEHGLEKAAEKRAQRWERILLESAQQCRRDQLPVLHPVVPFHRALETMADRRLLLDEAREATPLLHSLATAPPQLGEHVALLLGPEGGWTDEEREQATAGWTPVSLGTLILRAETAAVAALAVVGAYWQEGARC